jgi:hypothetical protein
MRVPEHPTQIRRMLQARRKRLAGDQPVLAATLAQVWRRCGRKTCACYHGGPLHSAWQLTYKEQGKTRTVYVPHDLLDEVAAWVSEHKRLKTLLSEIHLLSVALVKTHVRNKRLKSGRV